MDSPPEQLPLQSDVANVDHGGLTDAVRAETTVLGTGSSPNREDSEMVARRSSTQMGPCSSITTHAPVEQPHASEENLAPIREEPPPPTPPPGQPPAFALQPPKPGTPIAWLLSQSSPQPKLASAAAWLALASSSVPGYVEPLLSGPALLSARGVLPARWSHEEWIVMEAAALGLCEDVPEEAATTAVPEEGATTADGMLVKKPPPKPPPVKNEAKLPVQSAP